MKTPNHSPPLPCNSLKRFFLKIILVESKIYIIYINKKKILLYKSSLKEVNNLIALSAFILSIYLIYLSIYLPTYLPFHHKRFLQFNHISHRGYDYFLS